jgi:excinuclease UvrABC nuclease subunit
MSKWALVKDYRSAPQKPGVYVAMSGDRAVYVGSAVNLRNRLASHSERAKYCAQRAGFGLDGDRHWLLEPSLRIMCRVSERYGDWLMIELRLIRRLKPEFNIQGNRPRPERIPRLRVRAARPPSSSVIRKIVRARMASSRGN